MYRHEIYITFNSTNTLCYYTKWGHVVWTMTFDPKLTMKHTQWSKCSCVIWQWLFTYIYLEPCMSLLLCYNKLIT